MLGHEKKRFVMTPKQFEDCLAIARSFVYDSPPCPQGRKNKVIGIFGGEPLMSPYFPDYVDIMCDMIPEPQHRGLWTSVHWPTYGHPTYGGSKSHVERLLNIEFARGNDFFEKESSGYLNWNMHTPDQTCEHHPMLLAIGDVVTSKQKQWDLIEKCWCNRDWSAAYSLDANNEPKFYFCEIASSFDRLMKLGTGLPLTPGVWDHDLTFVDTLQGGLRVRQPVGVYAHQVLSTCTRCGQALPLRQGRRDLDYIDDISLSNLDTLREAGSPMVQRGDINYVKGNYQQVRHPHYPGDYIKNGYHLGNKVNER